MTARRECPIYQRVSSGGDELASAMRRLRRICRACKRCPRQVECDALRRVQEWVGIAAREVLDELRG